MNYTLRLLSALHSGFSWNIHWQDSDFDPDVASWFFIIFKQTSMQNQLAR